MKRRITFAFLLIAFGLLLIYKHAHAQGLRNYTCKTTSVTSASVPVSIAAPQSMTAWIAHTVSGAAVSAQIFPYVTTLPGSAPANCTSGGAGAGCMEVASNAYVTDQVTCMTPTCLDGVGNGWGAVLASGVTAITVQFCWR